MRWLPQALGPLLRVETQGERTCLYARGLGAWRRTRSRDRLHHRLLATPLLELTLSPARSTPKTSSRPRLEFRVVNDGAAVLAAIHDFAPSLPWPIYKLTQARAHLWVMRRFGRHLARIGSGTFE